MYKKVRSLSDISIDPRIERIIIDYDGHGKHMIECKSGFKFESCSSSVEVGSIKQLCFEINERLVESN
jgi:hypothetical protein